MYNCHTEQEIQLRKEAARHAARVANATTTAAGQSEKSRKKARRVVNGEDHYIGVSVDREFLFTRFC